jgi:chromate transporter
MDSAHSVRGSSDLYGLFFLKAGAFIFGSGLAIVPFLREGVVVQHHWLTSGQFVDAVAMGLITPGPVVITATFIGYLVAGLPGAVVATVAIFIPIYLGASACCSGGRSPNRYSWNSAASPGSCSTDSEFWDLSGIVLPWKR